MELNLRAFEDERRAYERLYAQANTPPDFLQTFKDGEEKKAALIKEVLAKGDVLKILCWLGNTYHLAFVADNMPALKESGLYEKVLLDAYSSTRINFAGWSPGVLPRRSGAGLQFPLCRPKPGTILSTLLDG